MKHLTLILGAIVLMGTQGCATWGKLDDKERGAVIGGGTGAVLGNAVAPGLGGTVVGGAVGAVTGGVIGNEVKKDKERDRRY